ncbi:MAG: AAA family ATPase [Idiomarina sp.]|nr:AAA family ATPase [Idiomarina sp.]
MSKLKLIPLAQIMKQTFTSNWLVDNYFEKNSVSMLFGEPGTYKSFLAMDLAFCVANGIEWNGNAVAQGDVLYIAGEGESGIQKRFKALEDKYDLAPQHICISSKPAQLTSLTSVQEVLGAIENAGVDPVLIVVDTLHRNFGDGDENSSSDFGKVMRHLDEIRVVTKATILLIHHSGHGDKSHGRGSSSIRGSLDSEYKLVKKGTGAELKCCKMKEFEQPQSLHFKLEQVQVKLPQGKECSAYLELVDPSAIAPKPSREQVVFQALETAIKANGVPISPNVTGNRPELTNKKWVAVDEWKQQSYNDLAQDLPKKSSQQQTFNRSKTSLLDGKKVEIIGDFVFIV